MPNLYTPTDEEPWPAERYYRDAPLWAPTGVVNNGVATSTSTGPLALSFSVTGGVITVNMATGRARVAGMLFERTTSPWTSGMVGDQPHDGSAPYPLNSNSQPRIDRLVIRRDLAAGTAYPLILQGTPAASPAAPTLTLDGTGVWDCPLFSWRLAGSNSTAISNIVEERRFIYYDGGRLRSRFLTGTEAFTVTNTAWTVPTAQLQMVGNGLAMLYLEVTRASGAATITPDASGDIANSDIGTVVAGFEPALPVSLGSQAVGRNSSGYLTGAGVVGIASVAGSSPIAAGATFSLAATFALSAG